MTDSIDIPRKELHRFKLGKGLGQWGIKSEGDLIFLRTGTYTYWGRKSHDTEGHHGIQLRNKKTNKFDVKQWFRFLKKGGGTYTRRRMVRAREALRRDGLSAKSALLFHDKKFTFKVSKTFREEFKQWLRKRRIKL
jgi:hypothetical protein